MVVRLTKSCVVLTVRKSTLHFKKLGTFCADFFSECLKQTSPLQNNQLASWYGSWSGWSLWFVISVCHNFHHARRDTFMWWEHMLSSMYGYDSINTCVYFLTIICVQILHHRLVDTFTSVKQESTTSSLQEYNRRVGGSPTVVGRNCGCLYFGYTYRNFGRLFLPKAYLLRFVLVYLVECLPVGCFPI